MGHLLTVSSRRPRSSDRRDLGPGGLERLREDLAQTREAGTLRVLGTRRGSGLRLREGQSDPARVVVASSQSLAGIARPHTRCTTDEKRRRTCGEEDKVDSVAQRRPVPATDFRHSLARSYISSDCEERVSDGATLDRSVPPLLLAPKMTNIWTAASEGDLARVQTLVDSGTAALLPPPHELT